jgi:hypothetical protein
VNYERRIPEPGYEVDWLLANRSPLGELPEGRMLTSSSPIQTISTRTSPV